MSTAATPMLFNALTGKEVMEILLRKARDTFEDDTRFRNHVTYPNLQFSLAFTIKYEPGNTDKVTVTGTADTRAKMQAQAEVIDALEKALADRDERFRDIEAQAGIVIAENEKLKFEVADANRFIEKLHADKLALIEKMKQPAESSSAPGAVYDLDAIANGGEIVVTHESEVIEEPDKLREEGQTEPEVIEIGFSGEAMGEAIPVSQTIGKPPGAVVLTDDNGKAYNTRDIQPARGAVVESGRPPAGVKGRPRG